MSGSFQDPRLDFYRTLVERMLQLQTRLAAGASHGLSMSARRARAQLDAISRHIAERMHESSIDAPAIDACLPTAERRRIEAALRSDNDNDNAPSSMSFRLNHVGLVSEHPRAGERHAFSVGMHTAEALDRARRGGGSLYRA